LDIHPGDRFENSEEKGRTSARAQAWRSVSNALILCHFNNAGADKIIKALNAATGWEYSQDQIMETGKRIFTLKRMLNAKLGSSKKDDRYPDFMLKSFKNGGTLGFVPDLELLLTGAYKEHGWDPDTGMPTKKTLQKLGLVFTLND
jgi:aldehyde:ferredoxin oxidoreductase